MAAVGAKSSLNHPLRERHHPGVNSFADEHRLQKFGIDGIKTRKEQSPVCDPGGACGIERQQAGRNQSELVVLMMIVERTDSRFNAGFITDIGIVLVEFENQIRFAVFVHDPLKIIQRERVRTAFE